MHIEVPHSCGRTPHGWPSLAECTWPDAYYVLVSLKDRENPSVRA